MKIKLYERLKMKDEFSQEASNYRELANKSIEGER
jgi:hypothetical protein